MAFVSGVVLGACASHFVCGSAGPLCPAVVPHGYLPRAARSHRASVQMNLFERFSRVVRSTANNVLNKFENPEKILEQSMIDMQNDLVKVRQAYAEVTATMKRLQRQKEEADNKAGEWYRRAQIALERGHEELAREALVKKTALDENGKRLATQIEAMGLNASKLADSLVEIEAKINEARALKEELVARARTAETRNQVNDMLDSVGTSSGLSAFERMREKVEKLEAESEVREQMLPGASPSLENKFKQLEASSAVEEQLAAMKQRLPQANHSSSSSSSSQAYYLPPNPVADAELERMKREMNM